MHIVQSFLLLELLIKSDGLEYKIDKCYYVKYNLRRYNH